MKIVSLIRRKAGTPVLLGTTTYLFLPKNAGKPDSPHVAQVDDPLHINTLLAITEGFAPADVTPIVALAPVQPTAGESEAVTAAIAALPKRIIEVPESAGAMPVAAAASDTPEAEAPPSAKQKLLAATAAAKAKAKAGREAQEAEKQAAAEAPPAPVDSLSNEEIARISAELD